MVVRLEKSECDVGGLTAWALEGAMLVEATEIASTEEREDTIVNTVQKRLLKGKLLFRGRVLDSVASE